MKKYRVPIILAILDLIGIITFNLNSRVLENGMLQEPFYLVPICIVLTMLVIVTAGVTMIRTHSNKSIEKHS
ncbi:MAG: DUF3955 domain-containing protein [Niameybacter sp.]|uniref:DUF3955 domain-containing protein n=1 Tax=Niameybacter sp. TaxID=2033640 RepID=UPI002FC7C5A9